MIPGYTIGELNSVLVRLTNLWEGPWKLIPCSNGFGHLAIWESTSCSSGYFWEIALTQETFWEGRIELLMIIAVFFVKVAVKKPLNIFFFTCPFSQDCWAYLGIGWNLNLPPLDMMIEARTAFGNVIFGEIVITTCWVIWTSRNRLIFDNNPCNMDN